MPVFIERGRKTLTMSTEKSYSNFGDIPPRFPQSLTPQFVNNENFRDTKLRCQIYPCTSRQSDVLYRSFARGDRGFICACKFIIRI